MSLYRFLLRSLRHRSATAATASPARTLPLTHLLHHDDRPIPAPASHFQHRTFAFSSAEEAAAERRRRKRRLRIEPPLHALRRDSYPPPPRDPNAPRLPDSTSALVGPRLNLHNRVQSLIRAGDLDAASAVARHSVFSNTRPTVFTCNAIIASMYRAKRYNDAIALFHFFFNQSNIVPNVVSYNNLINTHCDMGNVDTGLEFYRHIIANAPFSPSSVTYRHLTKGLIDAGRIQDAVDLLREMLNKGHGADSLVYNNLIAGFLNLGNLEKANELFDELKERCLVYDGVVNATFMDWFFKQEREKEAMESYKSLLDRQFRMVPATCNVLIEVLLRYGKKTEAWALFDQMLDNHTPPNFHAVNSDTFNLMVNECFKNGQFEEAIATFRKVGTKAGSKPFQMDPLGYNNIITRYCEHGMLEEAASMFKELSSKSLAPDVSTHRILIEAYLKAERIDDALSMLHRIVDAGLRVVASFGNRVFEELIKNGKAVDCGQVLTKMGEKDPKPDPTCYEVVIRGLCNQGALDVAQDLIGQMIRYGVGLTPSLREFVSAAFGNAGRGEEIERLLSTNRWGSAPRVPPRGPNPLPRPPSNPQMTGTPGPAQFNGSVRTPPMGTPSGPAQAFGSSGYSQHPMNKYAGPSQLGGPQGMSSGAPQAFGSLEYPQSPMNGYSGPSQLGEPQGMPSDAPQAFGSSGYPQSPMTGYSGPSHVGGPQGMSSGAPQAFRSSTYSQSQMNGYMGPSHVGGSQGTPQNFEERAPQISGSPSGPPQTTGIQGVPSVEGTQGSEHADGHSEVPLTQRQAAF
ncbi:hypothetical protein CRG98_029358 [Punica granatum]|uniref:Pentatricopeptide repeat-containing protein At1g10270 n=1 Tax=Punica granatum TaxID=22663 RepID=A0A2I0J233_PUNGR|nr:hypothetical protein CRG98_029358 [Punica granatum]